MALRDTGKCALGLQQPWTAWSGTRLYDPCLICAYNSRIDGFNLLLAVTNIQSQSLQGFHCTWGTRTSCVAPWGRRKRISIPFVDCGYLVTASQENTALPPTFEGLSRPTFPHGIHVALEITTNDRCGKGQTTVRNFLRISDPIKPHFPLARFGYHRSIFSWFMECKCGERKLAKQSSGDYRARFEIKLAEERDKLFNTKRKNTAGRYIQKWLRGV